MFVRADLADCGLYVFSHKIYKLILLILQQYSDQPEFSWCNIADDVLPFLSRNQYKEKLRKLHNEAQADKKKAHQANELQYAHKISNLMNPNSEIDKDCIKIMGHIDVNNSRNMYRRIKDKNEFSFE